MSQPATITIPAQSFTAADLLALTNYRIGAILAGAQSYGENGRVLTHADLTGPNGLYAQRDKLMNEVQMAIDGANGGLNVLVQFGEQQ